MSVRSARWRAATVATVVIATAGLLRGSAVLLVAATIPLVFLAVTLAQSASEQTPALSATRYIDPSPTVPGRAVTVSLEVTNGGDRPLGDVRIVDGVPEDIAVLEGSPRTGVALEPGETTTLTYSVVSRRGEYAFDPPSVRVRRLGGDVVTELRAETAGDRRLVCRLDAEAPPINRTDSQPIGQLQSSTAGRGLVFHSTREHRPDDPADRIDWRHYAKRGELVTVNYERQVRTTIWLVLDARTENRVVAGPGRPSAIELCAYAATQAMADLIRSNHAVGLCVLGQSGDGPAGLRFVPARGGRGQRNRIRHELETALEDDTMAADVEKQIDRIGDLVTPGGQIVYFGPLLDDESVTMVGQWRFRGRPTVVLSPDVVPDNTVSGQFDLVRRRIRLARCQQRGAKTFDWRRGTPLPLVIDRAFAADARVPDAALGSPATEGES